MTNQTVTINSAGMTAADVIAVARHDAKIVISAEALAGMAKTRAHIEALANGETPVYGISTGFGALANRHIAIEDRVQLQKSLVRSHAAGMGAQVEREVVRALMLLRLKTLASGRTGARPVVAETMAGIGMIPMMIGMFAVSLNWIATSFTYQAKMPAALGWVAVALGGFGIVFSGIGFFAPTAIHLF